LNLNNENQLLNSDYNKIIFSEHLTLLFVITVAEIVTLLVLTTHFINLQKF